MGKLGLGNWNFEQENTSNFLKKTHIFSLKDRFASFFQFGVDVFVLRDIVCFFWTMHLHYIPQNPEGKGGKPLLEFLWCTWVLGEAPTIFQVLGHWRTSGEKKKITIICLNKNEEINKKFFLLEVEKTQHKPDKVKWIDSWAISEKQNWSNLAWN